MSNLRQMGSALLMHAGDNGQKLPPLQPEASRDTGKRGGIWPVLLAQDGYMLDLSGRTALRGLCLNLPKMRFHGPHLRRLRGGWPR